MYMYLQLLVGKTVVIYTHIMHVFTHLKHCK